MAKPGELQYRVECMVCGRRFLVDKIDAKIPKHAPKGEPGKSFPFLPSLPCIGSGGVGMFVETKIKGLD